MGAMNLERISHPRIQIVGETDWRDDLKRWAARIVVFTVFAIVAFVGAWVVIHVETPTLYQLMEHIS